MLKPLIVVGVDGSSSGQTALRWAVKQACRGERELLVVNAYDWRGVGARDPIYGLYADTARARAEEVLATAVADVRSAAAELNVRTAAVLGSTGPVLRRVGANADLIVVGSHGHTAIRRLALGSVSQYVAARARGPVVVVRGEPDAARGPILVGVDGSPGSSDALEAAFDEATRHQAGIVCIRVFDPARASTGEREQQRLTEQTALSEQVAPWRHKYPSIDVREVVMDGHAGPLLAGVSANGQLIVVGSQARRAATTLSPASVAMRLVRQAECPVLIARPGSGR